MREISRQGWLAYALAIAVIIADQASKAWVVRLPILGEGLSRDVWGPLRLTLVENRGISFGLFQSDAGWGRWALIGFSLAVAIGLAVWVGRAGRPLVAAAVGLIIGGAIGNGIDRLRLGHVVDFIDVQALHFPWVFNLADSAINIGIALLLLDSLLSPKAGSAAKAKVI